MKILFIEIQQQKEKIRYLLFWNTAQRKSILKVFKIHLSKVFEYNSIRILNIRLAPRLQ